MRNFLRDDIALLEGHLDIQRERLRAQIAQMSNLLDEPDMFRTDATPETSGVDPSAELASHTEVVAPAEPEPMAPANPAPEVAAAPAPEIEPAPRPPAWHESSADEPTGFHSTDPVDPWGGATASSPSSGTWVSGGTAAPSAGSAGSTTSVWDDPGPATQPVQSLAELESGGDSFLDQLRRAVDDDLADNGAMSAFFDQDDDDRPKSRFGRRR